MPDAAALEASLKSAFTALTPALTGLTEPIPFDPAGADFTSTYTLELNVDELDAVRYDGNHLYVAPRRFIDCCFFLTPLPATPLDTGGSPEPSIRILATDPDSATATLAGTIPLDDNVSVQGMYIEADRMFALTANSIFGTFGQFWTDIAIWAPEKMGYRVYDVSDVANPVLEFDATIDGVFVDSRRIGNTVYIVSRYTPHIDGLHYYVPTETERAQNEQTLANVTLDDMLPKITINGETQPLIAAERCFISSEDDGINYPVLTSITAVPIDDPAAFTTTCYNEHTYGLYVSENALYISEMRPDFALSFNSTRIHKFALSGTDVAYRGSGDVRGTVWTGGQADFRLNEYNGDLRLLSSEFDWNSEDFVDHRLYILRESTSELALDIVSTLPNEQRPEEIGKPNEALYGVRFLGDRAYAVTFMVIDPLYTLDLSIPEDPMIAGELEVPGFSDFLHPVNDNLLLGLGTAETGGIKLELFDVSTISQPLSRGSITLGEFGSFSEALFDRHAFTYQANVDGTDRFAIPANLVSQFLDQFLAIESGLYLFEIRDKDMPSLTSLNSVGSILPSIPGTPVPFFAQRNRSFIHNDTVYYVRDETVWAAFWGSPTIVNGPY